MADLKIGLIARCERARGLAIQSRNFYDHMPVDRVLLVRMPTPDCDERPDWYPGATQLPSLPGHTLDRAAVEAWMEGLDVVFTVETPYDWSLPHWARRMGVKTIIQGNPEFVRHGQPEYEHHAHPDAWWWPTSWRLDQLPLGRVMPVPMPDVVSAQARDPHAAGPLRAFHVTGKRAFGDRNGTDVVINALRALGRDVEFTMFGLDHCLPPIDTARSQVQLTVRNEGVEDRWEMYDDQHLLVLPRRYAGLCLPALEAAAAGCAVMMTGCSPNLELASLLVQPAASRKIRVAAGEIRSNDVSHIDLAMRISDIAANRGYLEGAMRVQAEMVPRWSEWRGRYLAEMEALCS